MPVTRKGPIRVLLTVPHLNGTASPYRETMALAKYLPGAEFHLTICALRDGGFAETAPILQSMGVPCFVSPFRPTGRSAKHFLSSLREQKTLASHGPFDIQHSMDFTSSPFEAVMARLGLRRFVYSQRNLNENGHKYLLKFKAACAHRIITISSAVSRFLLAEGVNSRSIREVYLGLDIDASTNGSRTLDHTDPYVLLVGQFEPRKRHQDAIRAIASLTSEFPRLRLLLVGNVFDEKYLRLLRELATELGVSDRVQFLGPRKDVLHLMRNATALLLCSESEAFGWVLVEAMSVGLPVVASAVDGPSELIEHEKSGLLVQVGNVQGYACQLRRLITNPGFAKALSSQARTNVEQKFSAQTMVQNIQQVYREMLS
jgi:glycosyltransferase involved in cell wall biosynthesis